jgi:hypothetical protein
MTQMTQNPRIVSMHAGWRLGHLFLLRNLSITQMTQNPIIYSSIINKCCVVYIHYAMMHTLGQK